MELIDFKNNAALNTLREKMGTHKLGYYELFDPRFHLKAQELEKINAQHLITSSENLYECVDHTVRYKNARVFWLTARHSSQTNKSIQMTMHFSACDELESTHIDVFVFTTVLSWQDVRLLSFLKQKMGQSEPINIASATVCTKCMQKVRYKGYDDMKIRKDTYNQDLIMRFSVAQFYEIYAKYPVKAGESKQ